MNEKGFEKECEELSALMDGEVSEMELRRVLKNTQRDSALALKWSDYQLTASILRAETHGSAEHWSSVDLSGRISEALEKEPAIDVASSLVRSRPAWFKPLANVAVAASVSAIVVVGWQNYDRPEVVNSVGSSSIASAPPIQVAPAQVPAVSVPTVVAQSKPAVQVNPAASSHLMPVSQGNLTPSYSRTAAPQQEIIRYNPNVDDRLNYYLISHSNNAAMNTAGGVTSYARVVTIKPKDEEADSKSRMEK